MLTLQNILDSDSLSTLVAKLNANFSSIALSNGGPQGVRGEQGIPGLPGKQGATGPAGPVGATGPAPGIIPFSTTGTIIPYATGPIGVAAYTSPSYNDRSYEFLTTGPNTWGPLGTSGTGFAVSGQLYFDNNQLGWWKYLTIPDPTPTADGGSATAIDSNSAEYYVESPFFDNAQGGLWTGPDWYFYPLNLSAITNLTQGIWTADKTNYLGLITNTLYGGPSTTPLLPSQSPYDIANARMNSKFGTVWISSFDGDAGAIPAGSDFPSSNDTSFIYYWDYINSPRLSSGIDRSLFKISIDGPQYYDVMKAKAWTTTDTGDIIGNPYVANGNNIPDTGAIDPNSAGTYEDYFARPLYNASIDAYAPIAFYTGRNDGLTPEENTTLGYLQFSRAAANTTLAPTTKIHLFTTRQNNEFFGASGPATLIGSSNSGEALWDVRRFITSNQYLNMFPQDTEDFTSVDIETGEDFSAGNAFDVRSGSVRQQWLNTANRWKVYQGYHSVFTGQKVIENATGGNQNAISSVDTWMYGDRQSWYGTSIFANIPDIIGSTVQEELVRSAGVMVDSKGDVLSNDDTWKSWVDRVMIYTSNMISLNASNINNYVDNPDSDNNTLLSLPVALFSHTRNVGIGTFTNDKAGMFEPTARMHSHADWRSDLESFDTITSLTSEIGSFDYSVASKPWLDLGDYVPVRRMKSGAFTIERNSPAAIYGDGQGGVFDGTKYEVLPGLFNDWYGKGVFNDILIGAVAPQDKEPEYVDGRMQTYLQPTAGIRYESFNYTGPVSVLNAKPSRNYGWGYKGALRFGTSPFHSPNSNTISIDEIGKNANLQASEYQFTISPLSFTNSMTASSKTDLISGIGIHNIYPRTRLHLYGKNFYQEFRFDEAYSPGSENTGAAANVDPGVSLWGALPSNNQITMDYLGESYWYNAAMYDYAYDYLILRAGVTGTQYTANARNYPTKEAGTTSLKTRSTYRQTNNYSVLGTAAASLNSYQSLHGGADNAYWAVDKYIGFNAFRDLLGKGDEKGEAGPSYVNAPSGLSYDRYASNWRIGTEGIAGRKDSRTSQNGGSLVLTDTYGRMGFSFIPAYRDGGVNYGRWEQQNVGTREVVDNIKILFDEKGNIGIGNAPGYDPNAYPSLRYNPSKSAATGQIYYLPNAGAGILNPETNAPTTYASLRALGTFTPVYYDRYGLGLSPAGTTYAGYDAATINTKATLDEYIRFEISGEKANTRVGFNTQRRGYGYPGWTADATTGLPTKTAVTGNAVSTITITDNSSGSFARRYWGVPGASITPWASAVHTFTFDNLGRLINYGIVFNNAPIIAGDDLLDTFTNFRMPHPRDFGPGAPFGENFPNTSAYPWTTGMTMTRTINSVNGGVTASQPLWIPASAAAAELSSMILTLEDTFFATAYLADDNLQPAVMRLNNFTLGEGYQFVRSNGDVLDTNLTDGPTSDVSLAATQKIFNQRTASPKLLITYGAVDYDSLLAAGVDSSEAQTLINNGLAPLMKVTTVIESAQDETSLRTYTIPKAANTGGTFMTITDHMGQREIDDQVGLAVLPENAGKTRIRLDKVVAHEVVRTGWLNPLTLVQAGYPTTRRGFERFVPPTGFDAFTSYPTSYELLPIHYVKDAGFYNNSTSSYVLPTIVGTQQVLGDPRVHNIENPNSSAGIGANIVRDLDAYWEMEQDVFTGVLRDEDNQPIQDQKSEIRYRRLNENYVLFDFNINLKAILIETFSAIYGSDSEISPTFGKLGDVFGHGVLTGGFDPNADLDAFTHSPHAPGRLIGSFRYWDDVDNDFNIINKNIWLGVDARWVQYVRFTFDLKKDALSLGVDDPYFYKNQYGGGAEFRNWNEFRPWYPGTATVGPNALKSNYRNNPGSLGWNVSDGGSTIDNNRQFKFDASGWGFTQPKDGSPYSVWNNDVETAAASGSTYISRYWNGRINDWHASRWAVSSGVTTFEWGPVAGQPLTQQPTGSGLRNPVHSYTSRTLAPSVTHDPVIAAQQWQSWEGLDPQFTQWPSQNLSGFGAEPYSGMWTPWVNQYAYKQYWKWFLPINAKPSPGLPARWQNFYVEHPQVMDDIIFRSFGDDAWIRNAGIQWRITPVANGTGDQTVSPPFEIVQTATNFGPNLTFAVEVMFDKPLFVSGRTLAKWNQSKYNLDTFNGNTNIAGRNADGTIDTAGGEPIISTSHVLAQSEFLGGVNTKDWQTQAELLGGTEIYSPLSDITLRGQSVIRYEPTSTYETRTFGQLPEEELGGGGGGEIG